MTSGDVFAGGGGERIPGNEAIWVRIYAELSEFALITGLGYPVVKFFEVRWNLSQGLDGGGDPFQMAYYYLTFNHLVHVRWGLLGMAGVIFRLRMGGYSASEHSGLVAFASYWHATDLI